MFPIDGVGWGPNSPDKTRGYIFVFSAVRELHSSSEHVLYPCKIDTTYAIQITRAVIAAFRVHDLSGEGYDVIAVVFRLYFLAGNYYCLSSRFLLSRERYVPLSSYDKNIVGENERTGKTTSRKYHVVPTRRSSITNTGRRGSKTKKKKTRERRLKPRFSKSNRTRNFKEPRIRRKKFKCKWTLTLQFWRLENMWFLARTRTSNDANDKLRRWHDNALLSPYVHSVSNRAAASHFVSLRGQNMAINHFFRLLFWTAMTNSILDHGYCTRTIYVFPVTHFTTPVRLTDNLLLFIRVIGHWGQCFLSIALAWPSI